MDIFGQLVEEIIKNQEGIIGPIALEQAQKVPGLRVDLERHDVQFEGNKIDVVEKLVEKYKEIFGQASVEVCREAAGKILVGVSKENIPPLLQ
jgi:hypothetical protein